MYIPARLENRSVRVPLRSSRPGSVSSGDGLSGVMIRTVAIPRGLTARRGSVTGEGGLDVGGGNVL